MRRGESAVGSFIIFIAVLIVSAIAATVLIQTTGSLQGKAIDTGVSTGRQVSTGLLVFEVAGRDGQNELENISFTLKLSPGAPALSLDTLSIMLSSRNTSTSYVSSTGVSWSVNSTANNGTFGYAYLQQSPNTISGLLSNGDLVSLTLQTPRPIIAGEDLRVRFISAAGFPASVSLFTPNVYTTAVVHLYP